MFQILEYVLKVNGFNPILNQVVRYELPKLMLYRVAVDKLEESPVQDGCIVQFPRVRVTGSYSLFPIHFSHSFQFLFNKLFACFKFINPLYLNIQDFNFDSASSRICSVKSSFPLAISIGT